MSKFKKISFWIEIACLFIFFALAAYFTARSQDNYKKGLHNVKIENPDVAFISHNLKYIGTLYQENDMYKIKWDMPSSYASAIQSQQELQRVTFKKIVPEYSVSEKSGISVELTYEGDCDGYIDSIVKTKTGISILDKSKMPLTWSTDDTYEVSIILQGIKSKYVIHNTAIMYDEIKQTDYVYVVTDTKKVWGTEYSLKKVNVKITDTNGTKAALKDSPGDRVVLDPTDCYEGMLVTY